jgi:acyl-CoA thioesterase YciA
LSELVLQIMTMPADTNPNGKIFGGWVMAKMDQAASIICGLAAKNNWALSHYVTAAANNVVFHSPVEVGDILQCYAEITKTGKTSYTIQVNVHIKDNFETKVCEGEFVMVHIDKRGRPIPHTNKESMDK